MTLTLDLPEDVEQVLRERARARGVSLSKYLQEVLRREASEPSEDRASLTNGSSSHVGASGEWPELDDLLRFVASLPDHRAEAVLEPLDLFGSRADVYGYTEREDAQL